MKLPKLKPGLSVHATAHRSVEALHAYLDAEPDDGWVAAMDSVDHLQRISHGTSYAMGWWHDGVTGEPLDQDYQVPIKLALIHSEISEALEAHRKGLMDDKLPHRPGIEVELVDALHRIFDIAGALGLDLAGAYVEKCEYNARRPDHTVENRAKAGGKAY